MRERTSTQENTLPVSARSGLRSPAIRPARKPSRQIRGVPSSNLAGEVPITPDDIVEFREGQHTQIYIVAIGMKPTIHVSRRRVYASRLISNLMHVIIELGKRGVVIETMVAVGYSKEGRKLLQEFGFSEVPPPVPGKRVFTVKIAESGAPLILQYKQALANAHNTEGEASSTLVSDPLD